ncbi:Uncharacterised protein [Leminorella richardii]|uniref:Uncharacterized protein n=1 Tax=Leminorella richardii TaxID=158841 RepID=A0A2X4UYT8_9GAMM|nr:Uncharacterised protein [Leminorella richardii]
MNNSHRRPYGVCRTMRIRRGRWVNGEESQKRSLLLGCYENHSIIFKGPFMCGEYYRWYG